MEKYPSKSAESAPFLAFSPQREEFFKVSQQAYAGSFIFRGALQVKWCASGHKANSSIVLVIKGLAEGMEDDFFKYISRWLASPPPTASLQEIMEEVSGLSGQPQASEAQGATGHDKAGAANTPGVEANAVRAAPSQARSAKPCTRHWMLKEIDQIIDQNLDNDQFKTGDLAKGMNYCPMQVHRIIKELTDLPTAHYIRQYRLLRSQAYLSGGKHNVSEVAYMVGFKSPEHFARCFREEFGESPSQYRSRMNTAAI